MGKLLLAAASLIAACAVGAGGRAQDPGPGVPPLERGRILYEGSCQRCHALYMPASFETAEWRFFVDKYGRRARLSREQREAVHAYLAAASGSSHLASDGGPDRILTESHSQEATR